MEWNHIPTNILEDELDSPYLKFEDEDKIIYELTRRYHEERV
jgi:hypothetical protein